MLSLLHCLLCCPQHLWGERKGHLLLPGELVHRVGVTQQTSHTPNLMCLRYLQPLVLSRRDPPGVVVLTSAALFQLCCPSHRELIQFHTLTRVLLLHSSGSRTNCVMTLLECASPPPKQLNNRRFSLPQSGTTTTSLH